MGFQWPLGPTLHTSTPTINVNKDGPVTSVSQSEASKKMNAMAGAMAGCATSVILHPLDIIRTRIQVSDGMDKYLPNYRNAWHAFREIAKNEGLKGLYAGLTPAVFGSTISWSLYFFFYTGAKDRYRKWQKVNDLGPAQHLAAAAEAGFFVSLLTNPLWLVKTRLQLQPSLQKAILPDGRVPYRNTFDAVRSIWKQEGLAGFYRGLGPSLLLVSHGAIQLTAYEELRKAASDFDPRAWNH